jgi:hypothetical protein
MRQLTGCDLRTWRARERLAQVDAARLFRVSQRRISQFEAEILPRDFQERFLAVLKEFYHVKEEEGNGNGQDR